MSDFLLSMNINASNEDNLNLISPLFHIQVPGFRSLWFVVKEQICQKETTATLLSAIYKNAFFSWWKIRAFQVRFIFKRDRSQTWMAYMMYRLCTQNDLPIHLKMASRQSVRAANFIISIGEQLDRRPRKWHLLWVIEFSCCGLMGGPGKKKSFKWNKTSLLEFWQRADFHQQSKSYPTLIIGRYQVMC